MEFEASAIRSRNGTLIYNRREKAGMNNLTVEMEEMVCDGMLQILSPNVRRRNRRALLIELPVGVVVPDNALQIAKRSSAGGTGSVLLQPGTQARTANKNIGTGE